MQVKKSEIKGSLIMKFWTKRYSLHWNWVNLFHWLIESYFLTVSEAITYSLHSSRSQNVVAMGPAADFLSKPF